MHTWWYIRSMSHSSLAAHTRESALLHAQIDMLTEMDRKKATFLVLFDSSATFNPIDQPILIQRIVNHLRIGRPALNWFKVCPVTHYHWHNISRVRSVLILDAGMAITDAFVTSSYCQEFLSEPSQDCNVYRIWQPKWCQEGRNLIMSYPSWNLYTGCQ